MDKIILMKYGELSLKGQNKSFFETRLIRNIKSALSEIGSFAVNRSQSTIYITPDDCDINYAALRLTKVFGAASVCVADVVSKDIEVICKESLKYVGKGRRFKVHAKREDKLFPFNSPQINAKVGEYILDNASDVSVNLHNPDVIVNIEIRGRGAYIYSNKLKGAGGMPVGTNGRATLLLSGGIDSPVAGYMIAKRGVCINAVHFHSFPYTSDRSKEKVIELTNIISEYCGNVNLYIVPFTQIQLELNKQCDSSYLTIIMRRIMMDIAYRIAQSTHSAALITGEAIGQVASQTMEALCATDDAVSCPVFRPLIGMDKEEIVSIAKKIGTYETSILPYEDCCTVFVPKHPKTKPHLDAVHREQAKLNIEDMIIEAIENAEIIKQS